ncbi:hypothetical protein BN1723_000405 [Verticillium longisporum]|uniref:Uncharacterized protein n=1 Tax=Verticillium longisporum TaxID=100787 RepID=A0A0G4LEX5_VERLO|nr:hypothetical protein BN1723_000405 [Verticillium longisporum]
MHGAKFKRQDLDLVVKEEKLLHVGAHAELRGKDFDLIVRGFEKAQLAQLADGGGEMRDLVRGNGEQKGAIINMGSVAGLKGGTPHLLYPTSKGAIVNMTRAMAAHHAKDGIRVNCVCPGMLYTPMMYAGGMSEQARETRKGRSLLGTEGTGWDAAAATVFLASPHARWITGVILPVDAGTTAAVGIGMDKSASVNG